MQPVAKNTNKGRVEDESKKVSGQMVAFALNHMTVAQASTDNMLGIAKAAGCVGIELRDDLPTPMFDGVAPQAFATLAKDKDLRILALAEVYGFNLEVQPPDAKVKSLIKTAQDCGAEAVVLIPFIHDAPMPREMQRSLLVNALQRLRPVFQGTGITGLIEPLGFPNSSLRFKADVVAVLADLKAQDAFAMIHDTFHYHLAGEDQFFADQTRVIHVSGVPRTANGMTDPERALVDADDILLSAAQVAALARAGCNAPISFEAFAPAVHALTDPCGALKASMKFITSHLAQDAA